MTWVRNLRRSPRWVLIGAVAFVALAGPVNAQTADDDAPGVLAFDPLVVDEPGLVLQAAAFAAIDFDPWHLADGDITTRRQPVVANLTHHEDRELLAATFLADAQATFAVAERELGDAQRARDELELAVEGYAVRIWVLGDAGLQEALGSQMAMLRQAGPIHAATDNLVARIHEADEALAAASERMVVVSEELDIATDAHARADALLRTARQIESNFDARVVARNEAISRWTHEVLTAEAAPVELVAVESVLVKEPVVGAEEAPGEELPPAGELDEVGTADDPPGADIETDTDVDTDTDIETEAGEGEYVETVVQIAPIIVNVEIADNVAALLGAARADGIVLHGWGFREREMQIVLRRNHCGTSGWALFEMPAGECSPPTARPGHSEHELGLAIDFTENGAVLNASSPGFVWLVENAAEYGLINLPSEPWHWSTTGH